MNAVAQLKAAQAAVKQLMDAATAKARIGDVFVFSGTPNLVAFRDDAHKFQPQYAKYEPIEPELVENILGDMNSQLLYIVEAARFTGGGTGHGAMDVYPDGYQVTARRMNDDGTYNPEGDTVVFMQADQPGSHCYNTQAQIIIVDHKTRKVTFE